MSCFLFFFLCLSSLYPITFALLNKNFYKSPSTCPSYTSLVDASVYEFYSDDLFQGEWFPIFHSEPTEPPSCHCDRMTWNITKKPTAFTKGKFENYLEATCSVLGRDYPLRLPIWGELNATRRGERTEGYPPLAPLIPNQVLFVETNTKIQQETGYLLTAALVYSCQTHYLFQDVFESIQVLSRTPQRSLQWQKNMKDRISRLGLVVKGNWKAARQDDQVCVYPPSRWKKKNLF